MLAGVSDAATLGRFRGRTKLTKPINNVNITPAIAYPAGEDLSREARRRKAGMRGCRREEGGRRGVECLPPVVQNVEFAGDRNTRGKQVSDRADNVRWLHVLASDVILADEQDASMLVAAGLPLTV